MHDITEIIVALKITNNLGSFYRAGQKKKKNILRNIGRKFSFEIWLEFGTTPQFNVIY